jgi:hypothetical protein
MLQEAAAPIAPTTAPAAVTQDLLEIPAGLFTVGP